MYYHNSRAKEALKGTGRSTSSGDEEQRNQVFDDNKVSSDRNMVRDARIERQLMPSSSHHNYDVPQIPRGASSQQLSSEFKESSEKSAILRQRNLVDPGLLNRECFVFAEQPTSSLQQRLNPAGAHNSSSLQRHEIRDLIEANAGGTATNDHDPRLSSWNNYALGLVSGSRAWPNFGVGADQHPLIMQAKEMELTHQSLAQGLARVPVNPLVILNDTRLQQEGNVHLSGLGTITGYNDRLQLLAQHQHNSTSQDERMGQFGQRISGSILPHRMSYPSIPTPMMPCDRLPLSLDSSEMLNSSSSAFLESPQLAMLQQSVLGLQNLPRTQVGAVRPSHLAESSLMNLDLRPFLPSSVYPIGNSQSSLQPVGVRNHQGDEPSFHREGRPGDEEDDEKVAKQK